MADLQLVEFTDSDEQLLQQIRRELLKKPNEPGIDVLEAEPTDSDIPTGPPKRNQHLWRLLIVLVLLAIVGILLGWILPNSYREFQLIGLIIVGIFGAACLLSLFQKRVVARKRSPQPSTPSVPPSPWLRFLISLAWFVGLGILIFTPTDLAWLVGVLLFHELGHYLGMVYFGYRDLQMLFIPLLGAAVSGVKKGVPGWQEAIVLLLGPLPGLLLGCGIYFLDLLYPVPMLRVGATWLVAINFFNLFPFEPLDGGRFCSRLLFSRYRWLEAVAVVLGTLSLVFLCFGPGWILLALSGAFALFILAPARYRTSKAGTALQSLWPQLPTELDQLSNEQWRDLFTVTAQQFGKNPQMLANQMRKVQTRALLRPESLRISLWLFSLYMGALLLGIITASVTHLGEDTELLPIWIMNQVKKPSNAQVAPEN